MILAAVLIAVLASALALLAPGCGNSKSASEPSSTQSPAPSAGMARYTNDTRGFSFDYESDLDCMSDSNAMLHGQSTILGQTGAFTVEVLNPKDESAELRRGFLVMSEHLTGLPYKTLTDANAEFMLAYIKREMLAGAKSRSSSFTLVSGPEVTSHNGAPALDLAYTEVEAGQKMRLELRILLKNDYLYTAMLVAPDASFGQDTQRFQTCLDSFRAFELPPRAPTQGT